MTKLSTIAAAAKIGADVGIDEGSGNQILYIDYDAGTCHCGCKQTTLGDSRFRQGHDMKLVSKLLLAARNDMTVQVTAGGMATSGSAEVMARHFGGAFPTKLANRAAKDKAAKKPKTAKAAMHEENVEFLKAEQAKKAAEMPRSARCKVGRWVYDGTIEDGEFYYTNRKGEVIYVEAGKYTEVTGS